MGDGVESWRAGARDAVGAVEAALRRRNLAPRVRERLEMVKGVALGQPFEQDRATSGIRIHQVNDGGGVRPGRQRSLFLRRDRAVR